MQTPSSASIDEQGAGGDLLDASSSSLDPLLDPVRKYCHGKLLEIITPMFLEFAPSTTKVDAVEGEAEQQAQQDATDEQARVAATTEHAARYVGELERAMFEGYAEPDKKGKTIAGPKYKYVHIHKYKANSY